MKGARFTNERVALTIEGGSTIAVEKRTNLELGDFETIDMIGLNLESSRGSYTNGPAPSPEGRASSPEPTLEPTPPA